MAKMFYDSLLNIAQDLRQLVYKRAEVEKIKHNFCKEAELARKDREILFLKRNQEITIINRIIAYIKTEVQ